MQLLAGSVCFGNNGDDDNFDNGDDHDNENRNYGHEWFLTVPPDFQYQNVYVEENPPALLTGPRQSITD